MVLNLPKIILLILACCPAVGMAQSNDVERVVEVLGVEHKGDHRIRIYMSATERSGGIRYPISTIERNMVSVNFQNTSSPPAESKSLAILGSQAGDLQRALFVAFNLDRTLSGREISEVRSRVSELVADLPSQYLTVTAMANGSARVIADSTPDKSDNINRIQQQLAALAPEGEGPVMADTLCVAAERFHAWNLSKFKRSDQKALVVFSPLGDAPTTERFRAENCWRSLMDQGVRVYHIAFGKNSRKSSFDLAAVASESGGFVHGLNGPLDILAASKNIVALLKNEYILDVDAPDISLEDQPLELTVKVTYHDQVIQSRVHNLGFVIPTLSTVFRRPVTIDDSLEQSSAEVHVDIDLQRKLLFGLAVVGIILIGALSFLGFKAAKRRLDTSLCNTCGQRVRLDHSDCIFRAPNCIARLVIITGPLAGRTIPLMRGPNRLSSMAKNGVVLPRGGVRWFNHGTIVIDGLKVAYTPTKPGRDLINGWPVTETKLLGQGHVLKIGVNLLRFEIKQQTAFS